MPLRELSQGAEGGKDCCIPAAKAESEMPGLRAQGQTDWVVRPSTRFAWGHTMKPDRNTTQHPARNAIVILLLIDFVCLLSDVGQRVAL